MRVNSILDIKTENIRNCASWILCETDGERN